MYVYVYIYIQGKDLQVMVSRWITQSRAPSGSTNVQGVTGGMVQMALFCYPI